MIWNILNLSNIPCYRHKTKGMAGQTAVRTWPCSQLDFRRLAPRTMRKYRY